MKTFKDYIIEKLKKKKVPPVDTKKPKTAPTIKNGNNDRFPINQF
jgi:hypothetical protein